MAFVDTHCHLQDERFDEDREAVLDGALCVLDWLVIVGDDIENSRKAVELTRDRVYAAVGMHPYHAKDTDAAALAALRDLARHAQVKALGEIGLDYYNEFSPRPAQREAFDAQLTLAAELRLPVVIHSREASDDTQAVLANHAGRLPGCIMHCFGGDAAFAERCVDLGCHVSFAGNVTFPKAEALRQAAAAVPLERLLVETDAPYLAPQARRGKRCEPADVVLTASLLAEVQGVHPRELEDQTSKNARAVFGVA